MATLLGIDLEADAEPMFENEVPGTVLILDGDGACYRAAATVKKLDTAYRRWLQEVLTDKFLTRAAAVEVHITLSGGKKGNRDLYPTFKPYQANRNGKAKPALLEPLRSLIAAGTEDLPDGVEVVAHRFWEADDGVVMQSYRQRDKGIVKSDDKDLRMTMYPYYETSTGKLDIIKDRFGWISEAYTESLKLKVKGHGTKFFWAQMLMGDKADNIRGLDRLRGKLIGEAGALDFLLPIEDEDEAANKVLWEYARAGQNALAEAEVLWMRRHNQDSAYNYLAELDLDAGLRKWVDELEKYHQQILAQHLQEEDDA